MVEGEISFGRFLGAFLKVTGSTRSPMPRQVVSVVRGSVFAQ